MSITNKPLYDSAQHASPALTELRELGHYWYLLKQLVRRDILTRYKRSFLGVAWTMLNPLGTMLIMSFVFSALFHQVNNFAVYLLCGLLVWNFFAQSTNAAMSGLVWGGSLMKQIYVPRTIFGISAIGTALVNMLLSIVPLLLVIVVTRSPLYWTIVFLPLVIILLAAFSIGVGLTVSSLAVFFPDVMEMYQILLMAWMYLSPIMYPETIIPAQWIGFYRINPMYWMIKLFRALVYEGRIPMFSEVWPALAWALGSLVFGWIFFTSKADEYAYRI
ncbi:MAG: ABC transporter permease [Anaerolineaceae bacterium]|nr:ABC transporter permease [Anaerolineaceae bacterium]